MKKNIDSILKNIIKITLLEGLGTEISTSDINDDTDLIDDLGFHSIIAIRFIVKVEEIFAIEIDDDVLSNEVFRKYSLLKNYIENAIDN